jgi:hypothetical protein
MSIFTSAKAKLAAQKLAEEQRREEAIHAVNQPTGEAPNFTIVYIVIAVVAVTLAVTYG